MENIRLVIWDLDDTFWKGTISEGDIQIPKKHKEIIETLTDRGIMNSICSKNDEDIVKKILLEAGLWDLFVFPKISWKSKGSQIKSIIESMNLRPETVLFIDDNDTNLGEVKYYISNLNVSSPKIIDGILDNPYFKGKADYDKKRLKQYKILEKRSQDEGRYQDNTAFLKQSNIRVEIHKEGLLNHLERLHELNQRTNQLNYTKIRLSKDEMADIINNPNIETAYITVKDKYGDYGIVGFAAICKGCAIQFYFSCRTLGLGIEQWVYSEFHYPKLTIQGDVAAELKKDYRPDWINLENIQRSQRVESSNQSKVLIIGGCDLEQAAFYIAQLSIELDTQFNYVIDRCFDGHPDSSVIIRQSIELTETEKRKLIGLCPFYDENIYKNHIFDKNYDVIIYSPLIDTSLGLWHHKQNPELKVVYGNRDFPELTVYSYLSEEQLREFKNTFEFEGGISANQIKENLIWLRRHMPQKTKLILVNSGEFPINQPYAVNRNKVHRELNQILDEFCEENKETYLLDVRGYTNRNSDYTDSINHYTRRVYYLMSEDMIRYLKEFQLLKDDKPSRAVMNIKMDYKVELKKILRRLGLLNIAYKIRDRKSSQVK